MAESRLSNNENTYVGTYPTVFKKIDPTDVALNPFQVYKSWTVISGSSTSSMMPLNAIYSDQLPALGSELVYNDAVNINGTLQTVIYNSINHLYYKYKNDPYKSYGPTDLNRTTKALFESASVLSIPQIKIGEGIKAESFTFTGSVNLASDRYSNIYDVDFDQTKIVGGETFYEGFNEYFDPTRIRYISGDNVSYRSGVTTLVDNQPVGLCAQFGNSGANSRSYIQTTIPGYYDRDHDYAISFWIDPISGFGPSNLLISKLSGSLHNQYPFAISGLSSNKLMFAAAASPTSLVSVTSSAALTNGTWTHIVCQKTGSALQLYINGTLSNSVSNQILTNSYSPLSASGRIDNTSDVYIGGHPAINSVFKGVLDEVRIFNKSLTAANISALADRSVGGTFLQTAHVGNVFSKQGLIVISSPDYRFNDILASAYTASYKSTVTINELSTIAKLDAGDFNMSTNLSLTRDDDSTYHSFVSGSDFAPYITTIGLYNEAGQLLAIGKLAQPIKKRNDVDMNFLIRIDLDKNIAFKG
jgi:hypothetical protein